MNTASNSRPFARCSVSRLTLVTVTARPGCSRTSMNQRRLPRPRTARAAPAARSAGDAALAQLVGNGLLKDLVEPARRWPPCAPPYASMRASPAHEAVAPATSLASGTPAGAAAPRSRSDGHWFAPGSQPLPAAGERPDLRHDRRAFVLRARRTDALRARRRPGSTAASAFSRRRGCGTSLFASVSTCGVERESSSSRTTSASGKRCGIAAGSRARAREPVDRLVVVTDDAATVPGPADAIQQLLAGAGSRPAPRRR